MGGVAQRAKDGGRRWADLVSGERALRGVRGQACPYPSRSVATRIQRVLRFSVAMEIEAACAEVKSCASAVSTSTIHTWHVGIDVRPAVIAPERGITDEEEFFPGAPGVADLRDVGVE